MNITVWGLGHVGLITAAYISNHTDHLVLGIDKDFERVKALEQNLGAGSNKALCGSLLTGISRGQLRYIHSSNAESIPSAQVHIVAADTPTIDGKQNLDNIMNVCASIVGIDRIVDGTTIVIRSTMLPGTTERLLIPLIQQLSGKTEGKEITVLVNPCFAREIDYEEDILRTERIVIGAIRLSSADKLKDIYALRQQRVIVTSPMAAELSKYTDNAFHALKVVFANEVGRLANDLGVEPDVPLAIIAADQRLNLSSSYLMAGEPFGGRCLPKDMAALDGLIKEHNLQCPLIRTISVSNSLRMSKSRSR